MTEPTHTKQDIEELVRAAREAVEELGIIVRLGSRRAAPAERLQRLEDALAPFASIAATGETESS